MTMIINKTPHAVNVVSHEGELLFTFLPDGAPARCTQSTNVIDSINGIPITETFFGEVVDVPSQKDGIYYIVSRLVLSACPDRTDLLVPNELVRDENGNIIGCSSFAVN